MLLPYQPPRVAEWRTPSATLDVWSARRGPGLGCRISGAAVLYTESIEPAGVEQAFHRSESPANLSPRFRTGPRRGRLSHPTSVTGGPSRGHHGGCRMK
jgi:hypothetical protein